MCKVLVIMATYNGEKYLHEQIESILRQKSVEVDILVRDDGSNDKTHSILEEYKKEGRLQWYTGSHLNAAKGYYNLMRVAAGREWDYIAFSDQDDVWDLDKLQIAVEQLGTVPMELPALYYCGQRLVDKGLCFIADHTLNDRRTLITRFVLSDFAGCTGVFNRSLLEKVLEYEPGYMLMHDTWILKVCLAVGGNVIVDPDTHMSYRQHGGNSVGLGRGLKSCIRQVEQYLNHYMVEPQMVELLKGYGEEIVPEYRRLAEEICHYKTNMKYRKRLLDKKYINFYNRGLNLTYDLKICLNRL